MIASIDYLTLVVAGVALVLLGRDVATRAGEDGDRQVEVFGYGLSLVGIFLFILGTVRAFMGSLGI